MIKTQPSRLRVISIQQLTFLVIFAAAEIATGLAWALSLVSPTIAVMLLVVEVLVESWLLKRFTALLAATPVLIIGVTTVALVVWSYPSIIVNGLGFLTSSVWNPHLDGDLIKINGISTLSGSSYGALIFIVGTLLSSGIALLLAVPAGLGIAIFLTQVAPRRLAAPISFLVELMAGIPSVVYGFWGFLVLSPFLFESVEPFLANHLSFIPFFSGPVSSSGLLSAGIILALMAVPIIASTSRDAMSQAPASLKDGARALGLTNWEVTREIVIPSARTGIIGSIVLGLGRAFGESMAVAIVSGIGVELLPKTLFYPINTIAAFLVLSLSSAPTDPSGMNTAALMELALLLLIITVTVNVIARLLVRRGFGVSEAIVRV